jgi:hypothetical protein
MRIACLIAAIIACMVGAAIGSPVARAGPKPDSLGSPIRASEIVVAGQPTDMPDESRES